MVWKRGSKVGKSVEACDRGCAPRPFLRRSDRPPLPVTFPTTRAGTRRSTKGIGSSPVVTTESCGIKKTEEAVMWLWIWRECERWTCLYARARAHSLRRRSFLGLPWSSTPSRTTAGYSYVYTPCRQQVVGFSCQTVFEVPQLGLAVNEWYSLGRSHRSPRCGSRSHPYEAEGSAAI